MFNQKRLVFGAACFALLFGLFVGFNGKGRAEQKNQQVVQASSPKELDDAARPIVDFDKPAPVEPAEKSKRNLKNARRNKQSFVLSSPQPEVGEVIREPEWPVPLSDLPADKSHVIVEGIVADSKAFLSQDKTGVYSEFTIRVSRVLKVAPGLSVNVGDAIVPERFGGRVKYPSGQVIVYRIADQGAPMGGKRYLFFVANDDQDSYRLLTAYEIQDQKVFALDGSSFRGQGRSVFDKHNGEDFDSFLRKVESAINNSQGGGNHP